MSITFSPVRGENKLIFVENDSKDPIAIQITVAKREMNLSGEEQHPVTSDFKLFPSQLILKAGQKRAIRLALSQIESTKDEIPYRIIVEQLPIKLKKKKKQGASIKVLFRYIGSLYVTPSESKSDVGVTMTVVDPDQKHLRIRLENRGGRHQILKKLKFNYEWESSEIGKAAVVKMLRSIMIKGVESLLTECITASEKIGIHDRILLSAEKTLGIKNIKKLADYFKPYNEKLYKLINENYDWEN